MLILHVVMYHYVRDFGRTRYPQIKGMQLEAFRRQVSRLKDTFEMATMESALAFVAGSYTPTRDLCLLTFDDGLKEHFESVTPILAEQRVQGVFFVITSCMDGSHVASVHKSHFLMARLGSETYRRTFEAKVAERAPELLPQMRDHQQLARETYTWDSPDIAVFKYFFNFTLDSALRECLADTLFAETLGSETAFADELYLDWEDARSMQEAGMVIGGHTHRHQALANMSDADMAEDLARCRSRLDARLQPQPRWPFSYPYGKASSFTSATVTKLKDQRFDCAFSTEIGANPAGSNPYCLRRVDWKQAPA